MNIVLIHPPNTHSLITPTPVKDSDFGTYPPLGLMSIAAYLDENTSHTTKIIDFQAPSFRRKPVNNILQTIRADLAGIYTTTWGLRDVINISEILKSYLPQIKVVAGGPHVKLYPEETAGFPSIDYSLAGDGEIVLSQLVDALEEKGDLSTIKGLVYKKENSLITQAGKNVIDDLNKLPFPDYSKINLSDYRSVFSRKKGFATVETSRGCPFACVFCYNDGRPCIRRDPEAVVEHLIQLSRQGVGEVYFVDDTFNQKPEHCLDIAEGILKHKLKLEWSIRARAQNVDASFCNSLAQAGCRRIQFGVESGSDTVLENSGKKINKSEVYTAFSSARKAGITTLAYVMFGLPGESESNIRETIDWIRLIDPDYAIFGLNLLLPETQQYHKALEMGELPGDVWREFANNPTNEFQPPIYNQIISKEKLIALRYSAHLHFYLKPRFVLRALKGIRNTQQLLNLAFGFQVFIRSLPYSRK